MPDERSDGFDIVLIQAEGGHLGAGPPFVWILQPDRNPLFMHFHADFFETGADLFHFADQVARVHVLLLDFGVKPTDAHFQVVGVLVKPLCLGIIAGAVGLVAGESDLALPLGFLILQLPDLLIDRDHLLRLPVESLIPVTSHAAAQAE